MSPRPSPPHPLTGKDAPATTPSRPQRQSLIAFRADLLAPVEAIVGYCQMLLEDLDGRPTEFVADLRKLHDSARDLYQFVKGQLDVAHEGASSAGLRDRLSRLRHEIGNRLNQVQGYCQLLLMSEQETFFGSVVNDLRSIQEHCKRCEMTLLRYRSEDSSVTTAGPDERPLAEPRLPPDTGRECADVAPQSGPARILVADDNAVSRDVLVRVLERSGHSVLVAGGGQEALELLGRHECDLVLLDVVMPGLSGPQVLRQIKRDDRLRHIPVVMVSALDGMADIVQSIELGAEDFLTKPIDLSLFHARVNACLEKKRLREREYGQFFTPELARFLVGHPEVLREARDLEVSVLFCDVRRFSRISERLGAAVTVNWLSDIMATLSDCVIEHRGVLVDYIGDELLAMWGAPEPDKQPDHARLACRAAVEMLRQIAALSRRWEPQIHEATEVGIGLNTGLARVGNSGSCRKFKYGPLGNTVNVASRVQGATKYLRSSLLITGTTREHLDPSVACRRLCKVRVVNIDQPIDLYQMLADDSQASRDLAVRYEEALDAFESGQAELAATRLGGLMADCPGDGPSLLLMSRIVDSLLHGANAFDPVWNLPGK